MRQLTHVIQDKVFADSVLRVADIMEMLHNNRDFPLSRNRFHLIYVII